MPQIQSNLIVGKRESVVDEFLLLNPFMMPVTQFVGFGNAVIATTHKWYEDKMITDKDAVNGAKLVGDTTITVDTGAIFRPKQVIKIAEELLYVTAVSGNNLTVTRGYGSTTPAAIADNAVVEIMFNLQEEGSEARDGIYQPRTPNFNYTQIFDDTIKISGTAQAIAQYGIDDEYNKEKLKTQIRLAKQLENALVDGVKFESGDFRMLGGLRGFITENVLNAANAALTFKTIDDMMLQIFKTGAMKDATRYGLMMSPLQRQVLAEADSAKVRITQGERSVGRVIDQVNTNYGMLPIIVNTNFKSDEIAIVDGNRVKIKPLTGREFTHEYLGKTGDNMKGTIVGEYTMELKQQEAHAWIKGLKTT